MSYIGNQPTSVAFLTDTFSGTGSQTAFTMQVAPATTSSILVAITGVVQDPSTYSVAGTTLTFSAAPPSGTSNISVRYLGIPASGVTTTAYRTVTEFTATAGQTSFSVPSYTVGYIDVYRNGVQLGSADFTASTGTTVVLTAAATAGDLVRTVSFYVSSVLNAIPATAGSVGSTYLAGGAALANIGAGGLTQSYVGTNVAGTGPALIVLKTGAAQTVSTGVNTKYTMSNVSVDTANGWSTANSRYTPGLAGYYQVSAYGSGTVNTGALGFTLQVFKNGGSTYLASGIDISANITANLQISGLLYMSSTDYIELYGAVYSGAATLQLNANSWLTATLVRAA